MERWAGVLRVPLDLGSSSSKSYYRVAVSLCLSHHSNAFAVPSANAVFFNGDRVEGTGNPVIHRLSDPLNIAEILVSKFGGATVNAWVIDASVFNGPFAVYRDFIPSVNRWGEPKTYSPAASLFPASSSIVSLLSNSLQQARVAVSGKEKGPFSISSLASAASSSPSCQPKTCILGFSKGGTVLNQLVTELGFSEVKVPTLEQNPHVQEEIQIVPSTKERFLSSITEVHYVDVGLNSAGAYITDPNVIERISKRIAQGATGIRFFLHGTPRQWRDSRRVLIREEKDKLLHLLQSGAQRSGGKLQVSEKFYFADRPPDLQMHFEIIEKMDVSCCQ